MLIPPDKKVQDEADPAAPGVNRPTASEQPYQQQDAAYPKLQVYAATHDAHSHTSSGAPSSHVRSEAYAGAGARDLESGHARGAHSESSPLLAPPPYQVASAAPHSAPTGGKPRPRPRMRFLAAGCAALVLLVLGGAVAALIGHLVGNGHGGGSSRSGERLPEADQPISGGRGGDGKWDDSWAPTFPIYSNETSPRNCDAFSAATLLPDSYYNSQRLLSRTTSFSLPLTAELKYLHARGRAVGGHVQVTYGQLARLGGAKADEVLVEVEVRYAQGRRYMGWHVCRTGDDREAGVVILMPHSEDGDEYRYRDVSFLVTIDFPASRADRVGALEILSQNMGINVAALPFRFKDIDFQTTNGRIRIEDLATDGLSLQSTNGRLDVQRVVTPGEPRLHTTNGAIHCGDCCPKRPNEWVKRWDLQTSNGAIEGEFCAQESIDAQTTSGSVTGQYHAPAIRAHTTNGRIDGFFIGVQEGGLDLHTSSGSITAQVEIEDGQKGKHATYKVPLVVQTSNGAVDLTLLDLPLNTFLDAQVSTTNGHLKFTGHPHFQGDFSFSTSSGSLALTTLDAHSGEPERRLNTVRAPSPGGHKMVVGDIKRKDETRPSKDLGRIVGSTTNSGLVAAV